MIAVMYLPPPLLLLLLLFLPPEVEEEAEEEVEEEPFLLVDFLPVDFFLVPPLLLGLAGVDIMTARRRERGRAEGEEGSVTVDEGFACEVDG